MKIAIVGAGTAGCASTILLARAGHDVTLYERVAVPGPVGAGITLQPIGQAALARLGLLAPVRARGAPVERLKCLRAGRKVVVDLPYSALHPRLHGLGIHRGVLFETLFAAAKTSGAPVECGVDIEFSVHRGEGRYLATTSGEILGPYDLVVAADGSVCELHGAATHVTSTAYPWGAVWFVAEDRGGTFSAKREIHQVVEGARHMLGFLPTGMAPGRDTPVVSLFWSIRADRVDEWREAGLPAWRDRVLGLEPEAEGIMDQLADLSPILYARYRDVAMYPWHGDRVVFIGDAAHATSPQLGQGANLALVDAQELADAIAERPDDVGRALDLYTHKRREHLGYYQWATRALTPLFQHDSAALGWFRDVVFPLLCRVPWVRKRMVRTMLGIDRGLVSAPYAIEELETLLLAEAAGGQA